MDRRKNQISIRIVALANGQNVTIVTFTTLAVKLFYIVGLVDARKHLQCDVSLRELRRIFTIAQSVHLKLTLSDAAIPMASKQRQARAPARTLVRTHARTHAHTHTHTHIHT